MLISRSEQVAALLPDNAAFDVAFAALPEWRRRKAASLRFAADRRRSVAVWMLLRRMLAELGTDADALAVTENAFGKPSFASSAGLHFSLSHAGERVMAAVSDRPVGCDVERIASMDVDLAAVLTDAERMYLAALSDSVRDREFIRLWVRKESYVKAVGRGMDLDLRSFSALGPPPPGWVWQELDFADGYLGCTCFCDPTAGSVI